MKMGKLHRYVLLILQLLLSSLTISVTKLNVFLGFVYCILILFTFYCCDREQVEEFQRDVGTEFSVCQELGRESEGIRCFTGPAEFMVVAEREDGVVIWVCGHRTWTGEKPAAAG